MINIIWCEHDTHVMFRKISRFFPQLTPLLTRWQWRRVGQRAGSYCLPPKFWAVGELSEDLFSYQKVFCPKMPHLGLKPPHWGNLKVKLNFWALIIFSVGKLQLCAPPTCLTRDVAAVHWCLIPRLHDEAGSTSWPVLAERATSMFAWSCKRAINGICLTRCCMPAQTL